MKPALVALFLVGVFAMATRAFDPNAARSLRQSTIVYTADDIRRNITLRVNDGLPCNLELGADIEVVKPFTLPADLRSFRLDGADKYQMVVTSPVSSVFKVLGASAADGGFPAEFANLTIVLKPGVAVTTAFIVDQIPAALFQLVQIDTAFSRVTINADDGTLGSVFGLVPRAGQHFGSITVDTMNVYGASRLFAADGTDAGWAQSRVTMLTLFGPGGGFAEIGNGASDVQVVNTIWSGVYGKFNVSVGNLSEHVVWMGLTSGGASFTTTGGAGFAQTLIRVDGFTTKTLSAGTKNLDL